MALSTCLFFNSFTNAQPKEGDSKTFDAVIEKLKETTNKLKKMLTEFTPEQKAQLKEMQKQYEEEIKPFHEKVQKNFESTQEEMSNTSKKSSVNDQISIERRKIDTADKELIELLSRRMQAAKKIGALKKSSNIPPLQPGRWNQVMETAKKQGARHGLSENFIKQLMEAVHQESLRLQSSNSSRR